MEDLFGTALLDYFNGNYTEDILTETNISEQDEFPLPYLFRTFDEMPSVEQKALRQCRGRILDVGCGAGSHALYLQEQGLDVKAIDLSPGAVEVCQLRGIQEVSQTAFLDLENETFDTILLLMNGTGIFQNLDAIGVYLDHLKTLLNPDGQILIDSCDLIYMYDQEELQYLQEIGRYYGQLKFTMHYKDQESAPFDWLYLDEYTFARVAKLFGFSFEVLCRGTEYDYLARLTVQSD